MRLASTHACCDLLGLDAFNEDHLYANLAWLTENQRDIELRLFQKAYPKTNPPLYLYDVTSSYLEGKYNELGAFGYNRDGKRGKMQIVIGLLCDGAGVALAIEVFAGNTLDPKTMPAQIKKVATQFGGGEVTFVGDRGMIKGALCAAPKSSAGRGNESFPPKQTRCDQQTSCRIKCPSCRAPPQRRCDLPQGPAQKNRQAQTHFLGAGRASC